MRVPDGLHPAVVHSVKKVPSKSKDYLMAKVGFTVLTPNLPAKKISAWFCIHGVTANAKGFSVAKGRSALERLFRAAGRKPRGPSALVGAQLKILVGTRDTGSKMIAAVEDYIPMPDTPSGVARDA